METALKNDIKNGTFKNVYLMFGEEKFLTDYYCSEIIKANVEEDMKEFNYLKIASSLPSEEEIDSFASSYPFMSEKKILHISDTDIFKSASEKKGAAYFGELIKSVPDYLIIIFSETRVDKRNALYKQISKLYPPIEFSFKKPNELSPWLTKIFKSGGKSISSQDALYMCEIAGPSMLMLKSEAKKIITFLGDETEVKRELIDNMVTRTVENRVFEMLNDLIEGKRNSGMQKYFDLKALDEEPIKIISIIFKKFASFHSVLILKTKSMGEIVAATSMRDWQVKQCMAQANKLGAYKIASVMTKCRDMDFGIKNGIVDKWTATDMVIAEIVLDK